MDEVIRRWASRGSTCCLSCLKTTTARYPRCTSTIPKKTCATRCGSLGCRSAPTAQPSLPKGLWPPAIHTPLLRDFPRVLGRYVRDDKLLTLEDAIRKMTSANAAKAFQYDRGLLRPGMAADITVFNAATIIDNATMRSLISMPAAWNM